MKISLLKIKKEKTPPPPQKKDIKIKFFLNDDQQKVTQ